MGSEKLLKFGVWVLVLALVGLIVWFAFQLLPIPEPFRTIIVLILILVVLILVLKKLGMLGGGDGDIV